MLGHLVEIYTHGYIIHSGILDSEFQRSDIGVNQKPAALSSELYKISSGHGRVGCAPVIISKKSKIKVLDNVINYRYLIPRPFE